MPIGDKHETVVVNRICLSCRYEIGADGGCCYGCSLDNEEDRPAGTVMLRTYRQTVEFLEEQLEEKKGTKS